MTVMNKLKILIITSIILGLWVGSACIAIKQTWVKPGEFGDMFGAVNALFTGLALIGLVYTVYLQQEEMSMFRQEKNEEKQRRRKQIEPHLEFGTKRQEDGGTTHLMEITVSDKEDKMKNPKVVDLSGNFDGLNIGKKGQKCKDYQHRIAAKVPNTENGKFKLIYEDIDGNYYEKLISWYPFEIIGVKN